MFSFIQKLKELNYLHKIYRKNEKTEDRKDIYSDFINLSLNVKKLYKIIERSEIKKALSPKENKNRKIEKDIYNHTLIVLKYLKKKGK